VVGRGGALLQASWGKETNLGGKRRSFFSQEEKKVEAFLLGLKRNRRPPIGKLERREGGRCNRIELEGALSAKTWLQGQQPHSS
jgi:hypothetical protein